MVMCGPCERQNAKDNYNDVEAAMEFLRDRLIGDLPKVREWVLC